MDSWPATLPQNPFQTTDPTYKPADNILRTTMDQGPDKLRPLFTAVPATLSVVLRLDPAQRAALIAFIETTLGYVLPFTWTDFRTGQPATYRYASKGLPEETYIGEDASGTWWEEHFDVELMP